MARAIGQAMNCAVEPAALCRRRDTPTQTRLTVAERTANLKGAFAPGQRVGEVQGRRVVLVDDVFTTGATLDDCARVLRTSGVLAITALTIARGV